MMNEKNDKSLKNIFEYIHRGFFSGLSPPEVSLSLGLKLHTATTYHLCRVYAGSKRSAPMRPFMCFLCLKPSIELPQDFKPVVTDFIRVLHKYYSYTGVSNLILCKSCWVYLTRIHQFDDQLNSETRDVKFVLRSSKIKRAQMSLLESGDNLGNSEDLDTMTIKNIEEIISNVNNEAANVTRHDTEPESVGGFSWNKSDVPYIESPESCEIDDLSAVSRVSDSKRGTKEELTEQASVNTSDSDSESEPFTAKQALKTYEDKWLPKNLTIPASSSAISRLSERNFIYMDKYPFEGAEYGFKCGLCPAVSTFYTYKTYAPWHNIIKHAKKWHLGDHKVRTYKTVQRCIKVAPNRFQYGKYSFEQIDGKYQCGECGALIVAGGAGKMYKNNILEHIINVHQNPSRTFICEYCGMVYRSRESLRVHKISKHGKPDGQFPCSDCDKIFKSRDKVVNHQKRVHLKLYLRLEFICEICGKKYSSKAVLDDHVAFIHKGQKVECKDCGKMFASKMALGTHRNAHTGKTKYICDVCGMNFTQHYSVTRHKKTAHEASAYSANN